uniref:Uncharacterized protein n=1 Tax=Arundo donax TaxID=35708 RepID=A0A0A9EDC8_ARUDO
MKVLRNSRVSIPTIFVMLSGVCTPTSMANVDLPDPATIHS